MRESMINDYRWRALVVRSKRPDALACPGERTPPELHGLAVVLIVLTNHARVDRRVLVRAEIESLSL